MNDERHVLQALASLLDEARQLILRDGDDDLRPSQLRVIGSVPVDGGITITELAERVGMTKQGIGQFVTQLTQRGYLATQTDPQDRRLRVVRRTPLGIEAIHNLAVMLRTLEADWAKRVGTQRYSEFRQVLDEIAGITNTDAGRL
jgi:DNA-binding MarR family transcriptional regulator